MMAFELCEIFDFELKMKLKRPPIFMKLYICFMSELMPEIESESVVK